MLEESTAPMFVLIGGLVLLVVFYFFVIYSGVVVKEACFYTYWRPTPDSYLEPFWLFTIAISLLWTYSAINTWISVSRHQIGAAAVSITSLIVFSAWLQTMNRMWDTFEYELGHLTKEEYFDMNLLDSIGSIYEIPTCRDEAQTH
jgi:hypothetical protein